MLHSLFDYTKHPGNMPLTASAVRARINRLVKVGLLGRERIDNISWRTYMVLDAPIMPKTVNDVSQTKLGEMPDNTPPLFDKLGVTGHSTHSTQPATWVSSSITPSDDLHLVGAMPDNTHVVDDRLGVTSHSTQPANEPEWVLSQIAASSDSVALGVIGRNTQLTDETLGVMSDHTHSTIGLVGVMPDHTQATHKALAVMPDNTQPLPPLLGATSHHTLPLDLIDLDLINDQDQSNPSDQIKRPGSDMTAVGMTPEQQALAKALANLRPQAMSEAGIRECLTQPALTAAWLSYVLDPANGVHNPAAYLRKQVRSGSYPSLPTPTPTDPAILTRSNQDAPALPRHLHRTAIPWTGQPAPVAMAAPSTTRWPLDAG